MDLTGDHLKRLSIEQEGGITNQKMVGGILGIGANNE
jgi:hypothetical protein